MANDKPWEVRKGETEDQYIARQDAQDLAYHRMYGHKYCDRCKNMIGIGYGTCGCGPKYCIPKDY